MADCVSECEIWWVAGRRIGSVGALEGHPSWTRATVVRQAVGVDHIFTVKQARAILPDVQTRASELITIRADLVELTTALRHGAPSPMGGLADAKALEARLNELAEWFPAHGIQVKGIAPLLLDFPAKLDSDDVLLCWLEGEQELSWYHRLAHGFAGRRRIPAEVP